MIREPNHANFRALIFNASRQVSLILVPDAGTQDIGFSNLSPDMLVRV